jgi:hypothetical protein
MNLDDHEYGSRAQDAGLGFGNWDGDRNGNMDGGLSLYRLGYRVGMEEVSGSFTIQTHF